MKVKKETRYCNICHKACEYQILINEDEAELWGNSHALLWGNSHALLWGNSHALLRDNSHAELRENSHALLRDNSHAELQENSHAELRENSHAELRENSHAELWGNSHALLRDNSHALLRDNSHAELRENSHALLRDNSHAVLWGNSHAKGNSPYSTGIIKSPEAKMQGGNIHGNKVIPAREWLEKCGVEVKRGYAILFKSVKKDFTTQNNITFKPRTKHEAPDWDINFKEECGKGIHYCPTVAQCRLFRDEGVYMACRVKVSDMADLPAYANYPDKIRAKSGYTLYRVNENGEKL